MIPGFEHVVFWHWWILAGLLMVLQLTSHVFFLLWVSFAAALVGFLLLIYPGMPLEAQLVLFGALSVVAVIAWRHYRESHPTLPDPPPKPDARSYAGRAFTLNQPIVDGVGAAELDGSRWRVTGPDLPAGTRVRVAATDGDILILEADPESDP